MPRERPRKSRTKSKYKHKEKWGQLAGIEPTFKLKLVIEGMQLLYTAGVFKAMSKIAARRRAS